MTIDSFSKEYSFLSNFYMPARVMLDGEMYMSVEHAYQAAKSNDYEVRKNIRNQLTASLAKQRGREVKLSSDWDSRKLDVMRDLLIQKFSNTYMKIRLLDTKDQELIEGNYWHDNYWGMCDCLKCKISSTQQPLNNLGKLLMEIRQKFAQESS